MEEFLEELETLLNKHHVTIEPCSCMFNCGIIKVFDADFAVKVKMKDKNEFIVE